MSSQVQIERIDMRTPRLESVMALHRANAKTLGFLPKGAFEDYARLGQIITATDGDGNCIGYVLYRIGKETARAAIIHLCVAPSARGKGVARLLVERLKTETAALEGISLFCRRDYNISNVWSRLGFEALNKKTGRGQDGAELTFWWFSHGHPDLFSCLDEPDPLRRRVVIDANVFFDLQGRETPESEDSKALLADWVQSSIELVVTKELSNEIEQAPDAQARQGSRAAATCYKKLSVSDSAFQEACEKVARLFPQPASPNDEADMRHVAYAVAGGVPYLVTRDETLIQRTEPLYASHGLMVLHPAVLINHLDSMEREDDYRPARIKGSQLRTALLKTSALDPVVQTFKRPNDRAMDFCRALRHYLSQPKTTRVQVSTDHSGDYVLLGVLDESREGHLSIPLLRRAPHPLAGTLMQDFLSLALGTAATEERTIVSVTDPALSHSDAGILRTFGFVQCGDTWTKLALRAVVPRADVLKTVSQLSLDAPLEPAKRRALEAIEAAGNPAGAAAMERLLWPVKLTGIEIPSFIVTIRPEWAEHFFDDDLGSQLLFGLRDELHLGIEGVYYRSVKNNNLLAPGRILWYVSKGKGAGSMTIKACSQLEEVVVGKPKELFRRFQRLGVYQWDDVYAVAEHNVANDILAFRFRMTERFNNPVTVDDLKTLGIRPPFMSPRKLTDHQFATIYRKGRPAA